MRGEWGRGGGKGEAYESEGATGVLCGDTVDEHVRLWRDDRGVDEAEEEKTADERADRIIRRVRILSLQAGHQILIWSHA